MATTARKSAAPRAAEPEATAEESPVIAREIARPVMPTIPGRAVALNRAGMPIQRAGAGAGVNRFYIPPHLPPPDWSWEWKRDTCVGQSDPFYISALMQVGWEHVMYESYPGVFAPEYDEKGQKTIGPVRRDGLFLMERAAILTKEARIEETNKANERVGTAARQYTKIGPDTSASQTAVFDSTAQAASYIRKGTPEPMPNNNRQPID